ncbi:DUF4998 domain-containing protein [Mucilaginibacter gynuensis]|uniref:DUF4998 domain-containing protein n=1 Tax=Mucilaginibacter gynuensis TaxID=1302236 RepID=A0ABP8FMM4_9SPHI
MKKIIYIIFSCLALAAVYSCNKQVTDFKEFYNDHEIVYTGAVGNVTTHPGNLRVELKWKSSTDPSITKYVVYWNNRADSQVVNITAKTDSVSTIINGLNEFVYSFVIYSQDGKGNRSISKEVNNVKVYGPIYNSTLLNRAYDGNTPFVNLTTGAVRLNFTNADTINIATEIRYTKTSGENVTLNLSGDSSSILLPDFKYGTDVTYKSSYIPERSSIDVFQVADYSTYPTIFRLVQCPKSLFKAISLPNDVHADFGTSLEKMWDGSVGPQGYPNIFHSNEARLPHHFTFDLGAVYNYLAQVEETGRDQSHNPLDFEIWGIATDNINAAATNLPSTDAGWKDEMVAKGWTLLKEVVRTDDGKAAYKTDLLSSPHPVRYIRIRVKTNFSGENYSNISEFTFWNRE